jgi:hypothetical protein
VFIAGASLSGSFKKLVERSIFWCLNKEDLLYKLYSFTPDVYLAAYPDSKKLLLSNNTEHLQNAEFSIDFGTLFKEKGKKKYYLNEIIENKKIFASKENISKFKVDALPPYAIRCFEIIEE